MDTAAVLAAYGAQVRQSTAPDGTGATFEAAGRVVRRLAPPGHDGSGILWSDLGPGSAAAVIAAQVELFRRRDQEFEWKLYDYDEPPDLAARLLAAGFTAGEPESLMIAEAAQVAKALGAAGPPAGVRLEAVTGAEGVGRLIGVHQRVFGRDDHGLRESLLAQQESAPEAADLVVAMAGDEDVSAARTEYLPGTDFAGLWGGGTLPRWRRRGIYRALVGYRAGLAARRGCTYLTVDALPTSRAILERVGFSCVATTTPYTWSPR
jgi:GNAT superfamily N-acetyltransferase